jgi:hypothetical protein
MAALFAQHGIQANEHHPVIAQLADEGLIQVEASRCINTYKKCGKEMPSSAAGVSLSKEAPFVNAVHLTDLVGDQIFRIVGFLS